MIEPVEVKNTTTTTISLATMEKLLQDLIYLLQLDAITADMMASQDVNILMVLVSG
jgi:hypothetical protein